jgi:hypothetical protein
VVGAGGGATVGMLWLASECARFDKTDGRATQPESRYVAAAVWLDLTPTFPGRPHNPQREWLPAVSKHGVPMNFVCGAKSERHVRAAEAFLGLVKPVAAAPEVCVITAVPNTDKAGQRLLSEPATARSVEDYVESVLKHRVRPWAKRGAVRGESYWKVGKKTVPAKHATQPVMLPAPLELFGVR